MEYNIDQFVVHLEKKLQNDGAVPMHNTVNEFYGRGFYKPKFDGLAAQLEVTGKYLVFELG